VPEIVPLLPVNDLRPPLAVIVLVIVTVPEYAEVFKLPAASAKEPEETVTVPVPLEVPYGVNRTLYAVELVEEKSDRVPYVAVRSTSAKFDDASESEMSTSTELPALTDAELNVAVGAVMSTVIDSAADDALVTPSSVWVAVIDHVPSCRVPRVHDPEESGQVTLLEPSLVAVTVPVAPAESPETEIVGVESEVILSVDEAPESLEESKTGVFGVKVYRNTTTPEPPEPPLPKENAPPPPPPPPRLVAPLLPASLLPPLPPTPEPPVAPLTDAPPPPPA